MAQAGDRETHDIVIGLWPAANKEDWEYFVIKGGDAVAALLFVAQPAGDGFRANHGFETVVVPCPGRIEEAKAMQRIFVPTVN